MWGGMDVENGVNTQVKNQHPKNVKLFLTNSKSCHTLHDIVP